MTTNSLTRLSIFLTVLVLLAFGILMVFFVLVAANGFNGRQASAAFLVTFLVLGVAVIVAALLAARLARRLVDGAKWSRFLAVGASVFTGCCAGVCDLGDRRRARATCWGVFLDCHLFDAFYRVSLAPDAATIAAV
ncbi:MAG: hypothetical protein ACRDFQ_10130 [Anaerolineales bacterium]